VAGLADHEGLASPFRHHIRPPGLWPSRLVEVGELANMVSLYLPVVLADLAPAGEEPADQLFAAGGTGGWLAVDENRVLAPPKWWITESCDQGPAAVAVGGGLEALAWPVRRADDGVVLGRHLRHRRVVLTGQGLSYPRFRRVPVTWNRPAPGWVPDRSG
jgi:hypothetical protein